MPKNNCPCPPDNCYQECVEACVEECRKKCCDKKYRKLACKLLDTGLFVDSANYLVSRAHGASSDGPFYNILQHFADATLNCEDLQATSPLILNNQPANAISLIEQGLFSGVNVYQFTLDQWLNFNKVVPSVSDFTFIASPVVKYSLGFDPATSPDNTLQEVKQALLDATVPDVNQIAYINSVIVAVDAIKAQLGSGALATLWGTTNTPFTKEVTYALVDPVSGNTVTFVGKASVVNKVESDTPDSCIENNCIFLMYTGSRVVDVCPAL